MCNMIVQCVIIFSTPHMRLYYDLALALPGDLSKAESYSWACLSGVLGFNAGVFLCCLIVVGCVFPDMCPDLFPEMVLELFPELFNEVFPEWCSDLSPGVLPALFPNLFHEWFPELLPDFLPELCPESFLIFSGTVS